MLGPDAVSVLDVPPGSPATVWHAALVDLVRSSSATHVITHIECDPGSPEEWTWDVAWAELARTWDGVLLGVFFDSAFQWIQAKGRRLARISPSFVAVDICMPLDGLLVRGRPEIGPINMPMSRESLSLLDDALADVSVDHDVSFIGALYPYRVELIEALRRAGVSVAVNPHRPDETNDFLSSRTDQPSWLDYMRGLAASRMTLNFSRSSAGPYEQLKTRVLEGALAGTVVLTDDTARSRCFFTPGAEIVEVSDWAELPALVERLLEDPESLASMGRAARSRALALAPTGFWLAIDAGLQRRELPRVLP